MATIRKHTATDNTVTLTVRKDSMERDISGYLKSLSKQVIVDALTFLIKTLSRMKVAFSEDSEPTCIAAVKEAISNALTLGMLRKVQLELVYASLTADLNNYVELARADRRYAEALVSVLLAPTSTYGDVCRAVDGGIKLAYQSTWSTYCMLADAAFRLDNKPILKSFRYDVPLVTALIFPVAESARCMLLGALLGEDAVEPRVTDTLPAEDNLLVLNYEADIQRDLARLDALKSAGMFPPGKNATRARVNSLAGRIDAEEFPPEVDGDDEYPVRRSCLEVFVYSMFIEDSCQRQTERMMTEVTRICQYVARGLAYDIVSTGFANLLPAYSGFAKTWTDDSKTEGVISRVRSMISITNSGRWLSTHNFVTCYLIESCGFYDDDRCPDPILFGPGARSKNKLRPASEKASYGERRSMSVDWLKDITLPFAVHWLKMLCAMGMLEIAVSRNSHANDLLEGIRYVRLTDLGRYAFDLLNTYEPVTGNAPEWSYELESDGIISAFGETPPYNLLLSKIGRQVSENRFMVTARSLVTGSADSNELERNIGSFRSIFNPEKGSRWDMMLEEAVQRSKCHVGVEEQYVLVKLKTDVPGLVETVLNDSEICSNCIKAEHGILLVPRDFYIKLQRILHSRGYIL